MPERDRKLERVAERVKRRGATILAGFPMVIPSYLLLVVSLRRWRADYGWDSDDVLGFQTYLRGWVPFRDSFRASFLMLYRVPFNWVISGLAGDMFAPTRRLFLTSAIYLVVVLWCLNRATGLVTGLTASDSQTSGARVTAVPLLALFSSAGIMLSVVGGTTNHNLEAAMAILLCSAVLIRPMSGRKVVGLAALLATFSTSDPLVLIVCVIPVLYVIVGSVLRKRAYDPRVLLVVAVPLHLLYTVWIKAAGISIYGSPSLIGITLPPVQNVIRNQVVSIQYLVHVVGGVDISTVPLTSIHGIAWFTRVSLFGIAIRFCIKRRSVEYMRFALASLVTTSLTCGAFGPPELRYFCPTIMVTLVALPGALEQLGTEYLLKLRQRRIARWFVIVLSLALMFAWTEPYYTKHPKSPQFNNQLNLAKKLNERHVDILFAGYWDAGILSYLTGRDVVGLAVQCDGLGFASRDLNLRSDWKLPPRASYAVYFDATMSKECRSRLPVNAAYDDPFQGSLFFFDDNPWPRLAR